VLVSQVHVLQEGAAEPLAMLGLMRLIHYLADITRLGQGPCDLVIDSGTGVTAIGKHLKLPKVLGRDATGIHIDNDMQRSTKSKCRGNTHTLA
jgi:hypothetical protein